MLYIHLNFKLAFLSSFMLFKEPKYSENDEKKYGFYFSIYACPRGLNASREYIATFLRLNIMTELWKSFQG